MSTEYGPGFYRIDCNGDFQYAPNFVRAPDYDLFVEDKDSYAYPTPGGWHWCETLEEACSVLGIDIKTIQDLNT